MKQLKPEPFVAVAGPVAVEPLVVAELAVAGSTSFVAGIASASAPVAGIASASASALVVDIVIGVVAVAVAVSIVAKRRKLEPNKQKDSIELVEQ